MRTSFLAAMIAMLFSHPASAEEWRIVNKKDPITDENLFMIGLEGESGTAFVFVCHERDKKAFTAAGIYASGAVLSSKTKTVRVRFDGKDIKQMELNLEHGHLMVDGEQALDFLQDVREAKMFAYDFLDDNGKRFVDSFKPQSSNSNQIKLLEGVAACLRRAK